MTYEISSWSFQLLSFYYAQSFIYALSSFYLVCMKILKNIVQNTLRNNTFLNGFMNNSCTQYWFESKLSVMVHRIALNLAINQLTHTQNSSINWQWKYICKCWKADERKWGFLLKWKKIKVAAKWKLSESNLVSFYENLVWVLVNILPYILLSSFQCCFCKVLFILFLLNFRVVFFFAEGLHCQTHFLISQYIFGFYLQFVFFLHFKCMKSFRLFFKDCRF